MTNFERLLRELKAYQHRNEPLYIKAFRRGDSMSTGSTKHAGTYGSILNGLRNMGYRWLEGVFAPEPLRLESTKEIDARYAQNLYEQCQFIASLTSIISTKNDLSVMVEKKPSTQKKQVTFEDAAESTHKKQKPRTAKSSIKKKLNTIFSNVIALDKETHDPEFKSLARNVLFGLINLIVDTLTFEKARKILKDSKITEFLQSVPESNISRRACMTNLKEKSLADVLETELALKPAESPPISLVEASFERSLMPSNSCQDGQHDQDVLEIHTYMRGL